LRNELSDICIAKAGGTPDHSSSQDNNGKHNNPASASGAEGSVDPGTEDSRNDQTADRAGCNTDEAKE